MPGHLTRRAFLCAAPAAAAIAQKRGTSFPGDAIRYADGLTEFPLLRMTDPSYRCWLPPFWARCSSRRTEFFLYACDRQGQPQVFRMDWKTAASRQLTEAANLQPRSIALMPDDRTFVFLNGDELTQAGTSGGTDRVLFRSRDGFEPYGGVAVTDDGFSIYLTERREARYRLRVVRLSRTAAPTTAVLWESSEPLSDPQPKPRSLDVLVRRGDTWIVSSPDGRNVRTVKPPPGRVGPALWLLDGAGVCYLHWGEAAPSRSVIREQSLLTGEDRLVAPTSQYNEFAANRDGTVFVGSSASKAAPHVTILVRSVKRELTIAEHRSSGANPVAPRFTLNSQRIFFESDLHGKPAIYAMPVERLVEETEEG